jgi:hypothetical protein
MSFFSGFKIDETEVKIYSTTKSEGMATTTNFFIATTALFFYSLNDWKKNKRIKIVSLFFILLSILGLIIYYIKKNNILNKFKIDADEELNIIYFISSICGGILLIILLI